KDRRRRRAASQGRPPAGRCGSAVGRRQLGAPHRGTLTMIAATFDLRTGVGRAPDPRDYITKRTACRCAPAGTPHPLWTEFLERVTDHSGELQGFLQRYLGYCCTGFTTEHVFVFAYGTGANGKSTFINTIARIFGDYA